MTLYREPTSPEAALYKAIRHLSDDEIRDATGKSENNFRQCSNPEVTNMSLHYKDALALDGALLRKGYEPCLMAFYQAHLSLHFGGISSDKSLDDHLHGVSAGVGELSKVFLKAKEDGEIDLHEMRAIRQKVFDAVQSLQGMLNATDPDLK